MHQLLGFLLAVGQLRLIIRILIFDFIRKGFVLIVDGDIRKQQRIFLLQLVFGQIAHDDAQPRGKPLRLFQRIQLCKSLDIRFLQNVLRRLLILQVLQRQIILAFVGAFI